MPRAADPRPFVTGDLFPATGQPHAGLQAWAPAQWPVAAGWRTLVDRFFVSAEGQGLRKFIEARLSAGAVIFPAQPLRALELTAADRVRVVILGQDPYHGPGQAQGLAFSVPQGLTVPPSLRNILRERDRDLGPADGSQGNPDLMRWAEQGVLLLNTVLTVEQGQPASHKGQGWEALTYMIVQSLLAQPEPLVFMAWGAQAQALLVDVPRPHLLLQANHPSPLSAARPPRPFLGCGHFGAANRWLVSQGREPVAW